MDRHESKSKLNSESVARYEQYVEMAGPFLLANYGISKETAVAFRLGVVEDAFPQHRNMLGRLCMPYLDAGGTPRALKFRCLRCGSCEGHPKYLGDEGAEPRLWNVSALLDDEATTLYVTEGEMDCIVLVGELGLAAVGYPGTNNWRPEFTRAIGPDWDRIVVLADGDEPGRLAAKKVAKALHAEVLVLPDGEDVSSLHVKRGKRGLAQILGLELDDDTPPF